MSIFGAPKLRTFPLCTDTALADSFYWLIAVTIQMVQAMTASRPEANMDESIRLHVNTALEARMFNMRWREIRLLKPCQERSRGIRWTMIA